MKDATRDMYFRELQYLLGRVSGVADQINKSEDKLSLLPVRDRLNDAGTQVIGAMNALKDVGFQLKCQYCGTESAVSDRVPKGWLSCRLRVPLTDAERDTNLSTIPTVKYVQGPVACPKCKLSLAAILRAVSATCPGCGGSGCRRCNGTGVVDVEMPKTFVLTGVVDPPIGGRRARV